MQRAHIHKNILKLGIREKISNNHNEMAFSSSTDWPELNGTIIPGLEKLKWVLNIAGVN